MIQVSRADLRQFRAALRRSAWQHSPRNETHAPVDFEANANGLTLRSHGAGIFLAYHSVGNHPNEALTLPGNALQELEGRGRAQVTLQATSAGRVLARWDDGDVPHEKEFVAPKGNVPAFPMPPDRFHENPQALLSALHEAMQSVASDASRFATDFVQLRGRAGEIIGTDGRQLLVQTGFRFPWTEDVLVPRITLFGHDLAQTTLPSIGLVGDHVCVRHGSWTVWLPINREGRFPRHEEVCPKIADAATHLRLSLDDAVFLGGALPKLPGQKDELPTATLDLNGQAIVRTRGEDQGRPTDIVLTRSSVTGKTVRYPVARDKLARALALGFTELHIIDSNKPAFWLGSRGKYVFIPLTSGSALAPAANSIVLRSDAAPATNDHPTQPRRIEPMRTTQPTDFHADSTHGDSQADHGNGQHLANGDGQHLASGNGHAAKSNGFNALLEEANALQSTMRDVLNRTNQLVSGLKNYRRQAKTMASTLATLRQLEPVEA